MPSLIYDHAELVRAFVEVRLPDFPESGFGASTTIGIVDARRNLIGGVVYHNYSQRQGNIEMSIAGSSPRFLTPRIVKALLAYPFEELGVRKIFTTIASDNERSIHLTTGVGFDIEARLESHLSPGRDLLITRLTREKWAKIYGKN